MKKEKNIILCSILALVIGIATIAPLAFFMDTASAQSNDAPWFDIDLTYAYFSGNVIDDIFQVMGIITFDALVNSKTLNQQQNIAARVDFYEFLIYTDDIKLSRSYEYVGMDRPGIEIPTLMSTFRPDKWLLDFSWLNEALGIDYFDDCVLCWNVSHHLGSPIPSGGRYRANITNSTPEMWQDMGGTGIRGGYIDEISDTKLLALQNTQTIYIDIRRIAYMTIDDKGSVTTSKCDQLIQHIKLTKNGNDEFTFNNSTTSTEDLISSWMYNKDQYTDGKGVNGHYSSQFW
jgi:hypothetical protein